MEALSEPCRCHWYFVDDDSYDVDPEDCTVHGQPAPWDGPDLKDGEDPF